MTESFWTGGPKAYTDALRARYQPQLDDLRKRRKQVSDARRATLDAEIERIDSEYKSKLGSIGDCDF